MKGNFLLSSNEIPTQSNIYADKSALVLDWLLRKGINKKVLSLREASKDSGVSIVLAKRVFSVLVLQGVLQIEGVRTAKKFFFKKPSLLLKGWLEHYSIVKKCKMMTYRSGLQGRAELLESLKNSSLLQKVVLALHSAADAVWCKNTNLTTL